MIKSKMKGALSRTHPFQREGMNKVIIAFLLMLSATIGTSAAMAENLQDKGRNMEKLELTTEWDKTFPQSDKVTHSKITFVNRYGVTLAADMYMPKNAKGKLPAIAVSGPFGAVKEQASGLYAQTMAERGFLTIAFDPSYTGESGGRPRYVASPDINTEDFQAAVDFLSVQDNVDPERIGIIGICGWGGMAVNAAAIDIGPGFGRHSGGFCRAAQRIRKAASRHWRLFLPGRVFPLRSMRVCSLRLRRGLYP